MYIAVLTGFAWFACCIQISACFTWTKYPDSVTGVWNGSTVTLKWEYNLTTDEQNAANIAINRVWDRVNEKRLEFVASKNFITGSSVSYAEDLAPHIVISRSEEATLIINDVTKEDETVYKFTVVLLTLGNLRFARNFTLEVRVQPTLQCPETVIVTQGEQAIIPCNVTGDPKPNITWTKQSQSGKIISHNSTLVIDNAGISDNGIYNVIANNGRSASALMKLDIHFASMMTSVIVKRNPKNTTVLLNSSLTLLCVTNANPPALYHFYFNESYIGNSSSGEFNVIAKGDGVYTCVPINTVGTGNNGTLDINTVVRPLAEISQKIATAVEGGRLNLTCTASGKPEPKVAWTEVGKDDEIALTPSVSVIVGRPEIQDNLIQYRCTASNGVGTPDTATVNVTVYYKPYAKKSSDTVDVEVGGDISISCLEVIGNPPAAISWYRRNAACGDNITNNRYLNFRNVAESDTGWYTCFARNVVGNATFKVFVRVVPRTTPSTLLSTIPAPRPKTPSDVKSCDCSCKDVLLGSIIGVLLLVIFILFIYVVWLHKKETVRRPRACEDESGVLDNELAMKEFEPSRTDSSQFIQPHSEYMDLRQASVDNTIPPNVGQGGDYAPLHPSTRSWEVPRDHVTIEKIVGKGAFGQVARGKAQELRGRPGMTTVAIKMLKYNASESDKRDLMKELETMKQLKPHPHVIKLLGCVTQSEPFLVLIEYVPFGDLLGYLRKSRGLNDTYYKDPDIKPQTNLTTQQLMKCAWQIADGMSYLSSKSIIHRDLAARNVLVGEKETCKVTDFGMARNVQQENIYERKTKGRLPVKWTAYEALLYGKYTTKSDVWSFGVVLYEIFTIGGSPYPRVDGKKIANLLQQGYRMPKPQHVDDKLYEIMMKCWQDDPDGRPKFIDLTKQLKGMETSHKRLINMRMYDNEFYGNVEDLAE